jgi:glycosyltransferase involved in cell wall biosynthesis
MRIAFVDVTRWDYNVDTPHVAPLGGSQSALCYLAEEMAKLGHDVRLYNCSSQVTVSRGVTCAPATRVSVAAWKELDFVIVQNWAEVGVDLRSLLRTDARLILWTQHADDQPAMRLLSESKLRDAHDAFVFVSEWQRQRFEQIYQVPVERSQVLRNAIGPAFVKRYSDSESIASAKQPATLAYSSTPFRGLNILLNIYPSIRAAVPNAKLKIFSSMQVYRMPADRESVQYGELYEKCRATPGVEYVGSLPQSKLATELARIAVFSYPNTFAETSCISAMEAMASGCEVVTSDLGALPETTAGFGTLVSVDNDWQRYSERFATAVIDALNRQENRPGETYARLNQQVAHVNEHYTWPIRALEWQAWLNTMR